MRILIALGLLAGTFYGGTLQFRVRPTGVSRVQTGSPGTAHVLEGWQYPPKP